MVFSTRSFFPENPRQLRLIILKGWIISAIVGGAAVVPCPVMMCLVFVVCARQFVFCMFSELVVVQRSTPRSLSWGVATQEQAEIPVQVQSR